ncbi:sec-independent protein translocase protein TatB isoform X2 [Phoenix dactylifera]|uniref:Sec-independent protein translocase protein TatB isoform X2 n=1 Tax=Phoenix dactylifera TaxID=42345 RepID=A0A8B9AA61_PHODC|nr:sec-independent protein translocase protein TatB isoform X2 [Phoenix dactylifera]
MMFGISYGELFLILGATAALIGPKDLPIISRTAGKLAGRAIGYVQLARGQLETVLQQSQANKVHKELQDTIAQLEAIRYEIRSISIMNPGPFTRRLDGVGPTQSNGNDIAAKPEGDRKPPMTIPEDPNSRAVSSILQSQAMAYARLAESPAIKSASSASSGHAEKLNADDGHLNILPVSAESAGLLPKCNVH